MSTQYHSPLADKPEYLQAIGLVSAEWNDLEWTLNFGIWAFLGFTDRAGQFDLGRAVTTHLNLQIRLDMLLSLVQVQLKDRHVDEDFKKVVDKIRKNLAPKRNEIIHTQEWKFSHPDSQEGFMVQFKARGRVKSSIEKKTPNEIEEIAGEIAKVNLELRDVIFEYLDRVQPSLGPNEPWTE